MGKTVGSTQECLMYDWDDVAFIHEGFIKALSKYILSQQSGNIQVGTVGIHRETSQTCRHINGDAFRNRLYAMFWIFTHWDSV